MKKKLGVLVLALSPLAISAACASSNVSSRPKPMQPDSGENWTRAGSTVLPSRRANATPARTARFASR